MGNIEHMRDANVAYKVKPLSATTSSVGSRTAAVGNIGAVIVAHVARSGRLRIDAVIYS